MKMLNLCGKTVISVAVLVACGMAYAAQNGRGGGKMSAALSPRMPTMPTTSITTLGNPAVTTVGTPVGADNTGINVQPVPVKPDNPDNPDHPNNPDHPDNPQPQPSNCPDGKVENSTYTIAMCMEDITQCVNNGALQGGINDLFDENVRNSIMTGMRLCQTEIDKCVREVRVDCRNVYNDPNDVWLDFNSRVVQPEYYNFVLRKTGLTPNQAENTCLLLDRNTYGESFAAVSLNDEVNTEYNQRVGAYNKAEDNSLSKARPQGAKVNTDAQYDGKRGHYARWDAKNAECLIRVAAYNKDELITSKWWFGGNEDVKAEVWKNAGTSFTCSKDLFDFSLMNKTKNAAVVAVPGGAILGASIGAAAGAGAYNKKQQAKDDFLEGTYYANRCEDDGYRKALAKDIDKLNIATVLQSYLCKKVDVEGQTDNDKKVKCSGGNVTVDVNNLSVEACKEIHGLYEKAKLYEAAIEKCRNMVTVENRNKVVGRICVEGHYDCYYGDKTNNITTAAEMKLKEQGRIPIEKWYTEYQAFCSFKPLLLLSALGENSPLCKGDDVCVAEQVIVNELAQLNGYLGQISAINKDMAKLEKQLKQYDNLNKGKEVGKGAAIGAVTGAGAGGLATAITAFVEKSNIACKVGDGLNTVALGKSHTIDTLRNFYVKWNLNLPDVIAPTSVVTDRASWQQACSQFESSMSDCPNVQINIRRSNGTYQLVNGACKTSGSKCVGREGLMQVYYPQTLPVIPAVVTPINPVQPTPVTPAVVSNTSNTATNR